MLWRRYWLRASDAFMCCRYLRWVLRRLNYVLAHGGDACYVSALSPAAMLLLRRMATDLMYIQFMLIGTLLYYAHERHISVPKLVTCIIWQGMMWALAWRFSLISDQFPAVPKVYAWGCVGFAFAYSLRERFRPHPWLDALARISFPLYALHAVAGYIVIRLVMSFQQSFVVATVCALALVLPLTYTVHRWVEVPGNLMGKRLAARLSFSRAAGNVR